MPTGFPENGINKGQFQKGHTPWHKGKNGVYSEEVRRAMSDGHKGKPTWNKGKKLPQFSGKNHSGGSRGKHWKLSEETKRKMSESQSGAKHYNWQGGKSFEEYPVDWTRSLRISIRERDKYTCQMCNEKQGDTAFSVHHIDYDKKNCNPDNLITLCKSCHQKTNFNKDYWRKLFKTNL